MAKSKETNNLLNGRSSILEEDNDLKMAGEDIDLFIREDGDEISTPLLPSKADLSSKDTETVNCDASGPGSKNDSTHFALTNPDINGAKKKKEDDSGEKVKFAEDVEVYDLSSKATTPITVSLDTPVSSIDMSNIDMYSKNDMSKDSAAVLPVVDNSTSPNNFAVDKMSSAARPSDLTLSSSPSTKHRPSSVTETAPQEGEHTGHRHFDVSNVDEAELRKQLESEKKDGDLEGNKSDLENRPLLEKMSSAFSDGYSEQNTQAYHDTIGPLENPVFLRMLNYSVSQPVEEDAFAATSCLDLENFASGQPPADLDGGWAWVVLFAAFFSLSLTGATTFAAGVLMPAILEQIERDITKASWIGAVHVSVMCMSGPFVGIILNRLGAKWTAFFAGIVFSAGLTSASFATSILQLIFTHGLVAGVGAGFILNTMFVIVGQYFNRYRGMACGLLATGSGAGMLAGGSILTALFNKYGLSGTYLLWGGVTLHSIILAMLLRPSPEERMRESEKKMAKNPTLNKGQDFQGDINSMMSGLNSLYGGDQNSIYSGRTGSVARIQRNPSRMSKQDGTAPLLKTVLHKDMSRSTYSVATNRSMKSLRKSNVNIPASPSPAPGKFSTGPPTIVTENFTMSHTPSPGHTPLANSPQSSNPLYSQCQTDETAANEKLGTQNQENLHLLDPNITEKDGGNPSSQNAPSSPTNSKAPSEFNRPFRKRLLSGSSQTPSHYTSSGRLSYRPSIREQLHRNDLDNESLASTLVSHLQPQDALNPRYRLGSRSISSMMGSIASFPTALAIVKDDLARIETVDGPTKKTLNDYIISFLDSLRLLRNKPFLVFISTCLLWALADMPFSLYMPAYAISKGSSRMQASNLYTGMGFGSMCGRFLSGLVASDTDIGPVLLHIGCLGVASIIVILSPWITSTYIEQIVMCAFFGVYTGSLVPLSSLITIELLGIGELGLGFGFLSMAQGIGYLAGPPLLGVVIERIGFEMSFMIAGFVFMCASVLAMMIAVLLRNSRDDEDLHDSFDDLEKALRRISDTESKDDGSDGEVSPEDEDQQIKPTSVSSVTAVTKKKDESDIPFIDVSPHDGGGDHKEDVNREPLLGENQSPVVELGTITEEA